MHSQTFVPPIFPPCYFTPLLQHTTVQSIAFRKETLCTSFRKCYAILPQIAWELTVSTHLIQSPYCFDSYKPQIIIHAHLTHFALCWLTTLLFPSFPRPTFWQWHWSPHKVDINNSLIQERSNLISVYCVNITDNYAWFQDIPVPMYPVLLYLIDFSTISNLCNIFIPLRLCFVKLSSCLRDCNRHDDW